MPQVGRPFTAYPGMGRPCRIDWTQSDSDVRRDVNEIMDLLRHLHWHPRCSGNQVAENLKLAVLRLKAKGLPEFGGRERGDLYLRVHVRVPERLAPEERHLYESLRALAKKPRRAKR